MKKTVIAAIVSFIITLAGMLVNYIYYKANHMLLFKVSMYGGEITVQSGFGLTYRHIYTMYPGGSDSVSLRFDIINFLLTFIIIFIVIRMIMLLITLIGKKRKA